MIPNLVPDAGRLAQHAQEVRKRGQIPDVRKIWPGGGSARPLAARFLEKITRVDGFDCWLWSGVRDTSGYGMIKDGPNHRKSNRIAWELYRGPIPDGLQVLHRCDVRHCVNPDHLFLGTNTTNVIDRTVKGRSNRPLGERHPHAKLDDATVRAIRRAPTRAAAMALSVALNISPHTIDDVRYGRSWKHVGETA